MGFNFQIFEFGGGGSGGGSGIAKYPSAATLPATAADGDVAIVLDTNNLYSYDTGVGGWVIIGGPGVAITISDTNSIDLSLTLNVLSGAVRYAGATAVANYSGVTLQTLAGSTPGVFGLVPGYRIGEVTSGVLQFSGNSFPVMGTSFGIQVNQASGSTSGYLSFTDWTTFNAKVSSTRVVGTTFPLLGGGDLSSDRQFSINPATGSTGGFLIPADWTTFNNKLGTGATIGQLGNIAANSFLGNNTGGAGPILALTVAQTKAALGISLNNFGDVTLGAFLAATSAVGATISAAQVLAFTEAQTTNPGMVSPNAQTWNGIKTFTNDVILTTFARFIGGSQISWGSSASAGFTLMFTGGQGATNSNWQNDGLGNLKFTFADPGFYRSVSAAATLGLVDRYVEVTTAGSNLTFNVGWGTGNTNVSFNIQKIDSGLGTVTIQSDRLINGVTNFTFSTQWESHRFVDNGIGIRVIT